MVPLVGTGRGGRKPWTWRLHVVTVAIIIVTSALAGVFVGARNMAPTPWLRSVYNSVQGDADVPKQPPLDEVWLRTNASRLIQVATPEDASRIRQQMVQSIWGNSTLDTEGRPDESTLGVVEPRLAGLHWLGSVDRLVVRQPYGVDSVMQLLHPTDPSGALMIVASGHDQDYRDESAHPALDHFLQQGMTLLLIAMPLDGINPQPIVDVPDVGVVRLSSHEQLSHVATADYPGLRFFMEPLLRGLNHAIAAIAATDVYAMGLSGGGWEITLLAALDPRIRLSFPVAGSLPLYLVPPGDYEQRLPGLTREVDYLDLYLLGSFGQGRAQVQILNQHDPCCFSGRGYVTYEPAIQSRLQSLGSGAFHVWVDETNLDHSISKTALDHISEYVSGLGRLAQGQPATAGGVDA